MALNETLAEMLTAFHQSDQEASLQTEFAFPKQMFLTSQGNPIFDEMFDNITNHYISYSKYLKTASTKDMMILRIEVLKFYTDASQYSAAESKFDKFILNFRPDTQSFDKFAFSTIDFLIFPGLGVNHYTATELARIRSDVITTIPQYVTGTRRDDFIGVIDTIIASFSNGKDLVPYFPDS